MQYRLLESGARILNAGSASVRYGTNCLNVDIQEKSGVDVVCDLHDLPLSPSQFDGVICNAVLQYCQRPRTVIREFRRVLQAGGYLFADVPWVQPYCPDTVALDRFRFSEDALRDICSEFAILDIGASIRPGSAFAMLGVRIAGSLTSNRYLNFLLARIAAALLYPFRRIRTARESRTAGAFYVVCRKIARCSVVQGMGSEPAGSEQSG